MSGRKKVLGACLQEGVGLGRESVQTPSWRVWEWGFPSVRVCSSPHGSLSPGVGLCVLLSVSECACGGAGVVAGDLSLTFPWTPSSLPPFLQ